MIKSKLFEKIVQEKSLILQVGGILLIGFVFLIDGYGRIQTVAAAECEYWIAVTPAGNDANIGSEAHPWATFAHASLNVPDNNCTIWVKDGTYTTHIHLRERFTTPTIFKAVNPYQVTLQNNAVVIEFDGVRHLEFEGFEIRHTGPGAGKYIIIMDQRDGTIWTENVVFRNNIIHDSYNNDLAKIHNGARFVTFENNIFYNQADLEQHLDINSVTDVVIQDNIFFNDFAGSGRSNSNTTKAFIVVKDSNEGADGQLGSERITIRRNVFMSWEGGDETFLQIGNDGKPYHEARDVLVENNLLIGNSPHLIDAAFRVRGAKNVTFRNNTVVGDLPSDAFAMSVSITELNPKNENIYFYNNIWSDPTGTMGQDLDLHPNKFSDGDPTETTNLQLDNNLYWNGEEVIPPGELVSPLLDDIHALVGNPGLNVNQSNVIFPRWQGSAFLSGSSTIRQEFVRFVELYGKIPENSPAIDQATAVFSPDDDILGRMRWGARDIGAYEIPKASNDCIWLYLPLILKMTPTANFFDYLKKDVE